MPTEDSFDISVLNYRIKQVAESTAAISEGTFLARDMTRYFVQNTLLPILKTPSIYQMLQNPQFEEQLIGLIGGFTSGIYNLAKVKPNEL